MKDIFFLSSVPDAVLFAVSFLLGAVVGSFLNVVLFRYGTGRGVGGRSTCPHCDRTLSPLELIPLLSFLALRGRCRGCRAPISIQYPLVELVMGLMFGALVLTAPSASALLLLLPAFSLLVLIFVYDLRHKIIPDTFSYPLIALACISLFFDFSTGMARVPGLYAVASGILPALTFFSLWLYSRGKWMGLGDAKLVLPLGWMLGPAGAFTFFVLSFWIGAVVALGLLGVGRFFNRGRLEGDAERFTMKSEIPFGPFLIGSFLFVYFFKFNLLTALL